MFRPAFLVVLVLAVLGVQAHAVQQTGVPASVLSPTSPGAGHAVSSSVTSNASPRFFRGQAFPVPFGNPRPRHRPHSNAFIPVPIFIPAYPLTGDYSSSQPDQGGGDQSEQEGMAPSDAAPDSSGGDSDALRQAYIQGAHDALAAVQQRGDNRYGQHYFDSREKQSSPSSGKNQESSPGEPQQGNSADAANARQDVPDDAPATIFVFKDGHKIETQNYAIQGQTLFDFSNNHLTKVKLAELDLDATKKANDDLGIAVKLPGAP